MYADKSSINKMKPLTTGTHHVALKACGEIEYNKTVAFYKDTLGMPFIRSWGAGASAGIMLSTGNSIMEIMASGEDSPGQGALRHIAFSTADVDACIAAVRAEGYEVTVEPKDVVIPAEKPYPVRIAFCIGPLGEEVEFFTEK